MPRDASRGQPAAGSSSTGPADPAPAEDEQKPDQEAGAAAAAVDPPDLLGEEVLEESDVLDEELEESEPELLVVDAEAAAGVPDPRLSVR